MSQRYGRLVDLYLPVPTPALNVDECKYLHRTTVLFDVEDLQASIIDPITSAPQTLKAPPAVLRASLLV